MKKNFASVDWKEHIPTPIYDEHPEYHALYMKAWELAYAHIKHIDGMPQTPYMDEAFCATQIWIWDTCFMSLFCKYAQDVFPGKESLNNFYEVLYNSKTLPSVITPEDEPGWTHAKPGEPFHVKVHIADNPPLFAWAEYENALFHGDTDYIRTLLYEKKVLQKHYEWIESLVESATLPNVHCKTCLIAEKYGYRWEGGSSGMDNTPRGRIGERAEKERPNNPAMLWIDAICQQALTADLIAKMYALVGDSQEAASWKNRFSEKQHIVNSFYWDDEDKFYYDIDVNTHKFYKVMTTASYWTLTAGIASEEQAAHLAKKVHDSDTFGGSVPLLSLARNDHDYKPDGRYWRGALWLPTAYASLRGLIRYGFYGEAHEASCKILRHMYDTYANYDPHTIWECYAPEKCEPATDVKGVKTVRRDFCGWSALGPISVYIEGLLGFHTVNAFARVVEWAKPCGVKGKIGIKNLRFGDIVTDIVATENDCTVISNGEYTLAVNGKQYFIKCGENQIDL